MGSVGKLAILVSKCLSNFDGFIRLTANNLLHKTKPHIRLRVNPYLLWSVLYFLFLVFLWFQRCWHLESSWLLFLLPGGRWIGGKTQKSLLFVFNILTMHSVVLSMHFIFALNLHFCLYTAVSGQLRTADIKDIVSLCNTRIKTKAANYLKNPIESSNNAVIVCPSFMRSMEILSDRNDKSNHP